MSSVSRLTIGAVMALILGLALATAAFSQEPDRSTSPVHPKVNSSDTQTIQPRAACNLPRTKNGYAEGWCRPARGEQVRLRADCKYYPDRYSAWKGFKKTRYNNYRYFYTGKCPFGIRGGIWNVR